MSVIQSTIRSRTWVFWVTALSLVLGGLLAGSLKTQRTLKRTFGFSGGRGGGILAAWSDQTEINKTLRVEIQELRERNTDWEKKFASRDSSTTALGDELQRVKVLAGLVAVEGPGVVVTLRDRKLPAGPGDDTLLADEIGLVHSYDLHMVVDELLAAGAEAIAINDQRIVATTAIRCTGPTTKVNNVDMGSPYVIKAVGNTKTLMGAMTMPGGIIDRAFGSVRMMKVNEEKNIVLPAYNGSTAMKYSKITQDGT